MERWTQSREVSAAVLRQRRRVRMISQMFETATNTCLDILAPNGLRPVSMFHWQLQIKCEFSHTGREFYPAVLRKSVYTKSSPTRVYPLLGNMN